MITPIEIQSKTFKSGGLGYDKKDVDGFLREVLRSYETVYRENMELTDKVNVLTEGIQYYKTIEKTLQKALVLAEKTAEDTRIAAEEKAKNIEREARSRSQMIVADAKNELERIHNQTIQLIQQYEKYKLQFKKLAEAQMELIQSEAFDISVARLDSFISVNDNTDTQKADTTKADNEYADDENAYAEKMNSKRADAEKADLQKKKENKAKILGPEEFEPDEAVQEAAATREGRRYSNDDLNVEFDTSFMDSYKDDLPTNPLDDESEYDEFEDVEDESRSEKKHKKHKKGRGDFSFFKLNDEED